MEFKIYLLISLIIVIAIITLLIHVNAPILLAAWMAVCYVVIIINALDNR
jgi:hypothetical protein